MTRVEEQQIIAQPSTDPRFAAFYTAERGAFPIGWNIDHELPADVGAQFLAQRRPDDVWLRAVLLRAMPTVDEASTIAHEIMHFVLLNAGYPYIWAMNPEQADDATIDRLARLANTPHDLLIAERLSVYGFPAPAYHGDLDLVALCRSRGYQTPAKMKQLLEHLIDRAGLWPVAVVG